MDAGSGGIRSAFQFKSYKIDKCKFFSKPDLSILNYSEFIPADAWKLAIGVRNPLFFQQEKNYVGGFDLKLEISDETNKSETLPEEHIFLKFELGIAGVFVVEEGRLSQELEEGLVKVHIPAILLPYARGAATSFLANAGFGSVIFPLINIHVLAKEQMKDRKVVVIE